MSIAAFWEFQRTVIEDPALTKELCSADTLSELFAQVIAKARERGLEITDDDLRAVVNANRRAWLERWLYQ